MISLPLAAAAVLTVLVGVVHSWLGEIRLISPLVDGPNRAQLLEHSHFARKLVRFAWHITTLAWLGIAAILAILATGPLGGNDRFILMAIAATFMISGMISFIISRGRHVGWPLFLAISAATLAPLF